MSIASPIAAPRRRAKGLSAAFAALAVLMLAWAGWPGATAQEPAPDAVALVIGNSGGSVPSAAMAAQDAAAMAALLEDMGYVVLVGQDVDQASLIDMLARFDRLLDGAEIGVVYFAGRTRQADGRTILLSADAPDDTGDNAAVQGVNIDAVFGLLDRPGLEGVVLLDLRADDAADGHPAGAMTPPLNISVALALNGAGNFALDGDGRSPFTATMLEFLAIPDLPVGDLLALVRDVTVGVTNGRQEPWVVLSVHAGEVTLREGNIGDAAIAGLPVQRPTQADSEPGLVVEDEPVPVIVADPVPQAVPEPYEEPGTNTDAEEDGLTGAMPMSPPVVVYDADGNAEPGQDTIAADEDVIVLGYVDMPETVPEVQAEPAPPPPPATEQVSRYPALQTPDTAAPGDLVPVMVWLSTAPFAEPLEISAGAASVGEDGLLTFDLPVDDPNNPVWDISVVVHAPGFAFEGGDPAATVQLTTVGDSTRALFMLRATDALAEQSTARISATLWHDGSFLAEVARVIAVTAENGPTDGGGQQIAVVDANQIAPTALTLQPDLTVRIDYDDPAALGSGQVIIASPYLDGLLIGEFEVQPSTTDWLREQYRGFVDARHRDLQARGATHPTENGSAEAGEVQLARLRLDGFGQRLYQEFAPQLFKEALWELIDNPDVDLSTIQIYSNNPILPWELMRPVPPGGGEARNYLGAEFQIARWHVGGDEIVRPRPSQELHLDTIAAVAPSYDATDRLSYQTVELAAIGAMPGYRNVPGTLNAVFSLLTGAPAGIIHFAGHGVVRGDGQTVPYFAIALEDAELDLMSWRGMIGSAVLDDVLVFFNACDVAQTQYVANFVDGWAPAVLDAGALGFIGGLWPVFDESAARFAADFYAAMPAAGGADVHPAAVLRDLRAQFAETGDPTFLSYVFFGDVNLTVSAAQN